TGGSGGQAEPGGAKRSAAHTTTTTPSRALSRPAARIIRPRLPRPGVWARPDGETGGFRLRDAEVDAVGRATARRHGDGGGGAGDDGPGAVGAGGFGDGEGDRRVAPAVDREQGQVDGRAPVHAVVAEGDVPAVLHRAEVGAGDGHLGPGGRGGGRDRGDARSGRDVGDGDVVQVDRAGVAAGAGHRDEVRAAGQGHRAGNRA